MNVNHITPWTIITAFALTLTAASPCSAQDQTETTGKPAGDNAEVVVAQDEATTQDANEATAEAKPAPRRKPTPPMATQHLVSPGEDWGVVLSRANPGDQILLMPGEHRSVTVDGGGGSPEAPVVVRPLDPSQPVLIKGDRYGIRLRHVHDVVLENLIVRGASLRGITISNGEPNPSTILDDNAGGPMVSWAPVEHANVVLRNLRVERIGPTGQRPAIMIQHVDGVEIHDVVIEGWGGAAVEIVGARNINLHDMTFNPLEDHSQLHGVSVRAAASDILIHNCRFNGVVESVIQLGGGSKAFEFIEPAEESETEQSAVSLFDAWNVVFERNVISDCGPAFGIVSATNSSLRYNTILRPREHVVILNNPPQEQQPIQPPHMLTLEYNLITWEPGDLISYTLMDEDFPTDTITMGRNFWWSTEEPEQRKALEPFPGPVVNPQVTKVNPLLDNELRPNAAEAIPFGHRGR